MFAPVQESLDPNVRNFLLSLKKRDISAANAEGKQIYVYTPLLNAQDVENLFRTRFRNGKSPFDINQSKHITARLGIVSLLRQTSVGNTIFNIQNSDDMEGFIWSSQLTEDLKYKESLNIVILKAKRIATKGLTKCGNCGSDEVYSLLKQTRSSDEGMSTLNECASCGEKWKT